MKAEFKKTIHITEETMRVKQMLVTMSHEIRSPLSGVVGMDEIWCFSLLMTFSVSPSTLMDLLLMEFTTYTLLVTIFGSFVFWTFHPFVSHSKKICTVLNWCFSKSEDHHILLTKLPSPNYHCREALRPQSVQWKNPLRFLL